MVQYSNSLGPREYDIFSLAPGNVCSDASAPSHETIKPTATASRDAPDAVGGTKYLGTKDIRYVGSGVSGGLKLMMDSKSTEGRETARFLLSDGGLGRDGEIGDNLSRS
ncbi:hypothetical protein EJ04DRAFT_522106 [Polyplosphaeria fusca]|uniref:Uncharacterized protein n=1 Tax=Polyplosphaeria fusca TaxID=682080 RepID=A0A9P4V4L5_9PLEO|nr:hypothetical protein EJ04DRAFT_522106 [Polyplosphaeria fusca]